jgi:hypothetical protein
VIVAIILAWAVAGRGHADERRALQQASPTRAGVDGVRIAAAGDIACDSSTAAFNDGEGTGSLCRQRATSDLLVRRAYARVLVLGDTQYESASTDAFPDSYTPTWGRFKRITAPVPGNHDYKTAGAAGYFQYFGSAAGNRLKGYYSFDVGGWHLVALNSNCSQVGGCGVGSAQERWLRKDLAASSARCTLAYWHHPRFSSGHHGGSMEYEPFWRALYRAGADVVLTAHDHDYERFAPQDSSGKVDRKRGIRQFVVGTGGRSLRGIGRLEAHSEAHSDSTFGILELTLGRRAYVWRFRPAVGTFTDSGSAKCH